MLQLDNERRACIVFNAWNLFPESAAEEDVLQVLPN